MSSDAYLEQISPYLLDRFKIYPSLTDIYRNYYVIEESIESGLVVGN